MESNNTWSYDWLPVEILEMIISQLPDFTAFRNSRLVNCLWYTVTHNLSESYWKLKYAYYFGGPKQEGQSDEEAFNVAQKDVIRQHKQLNSMMLGSVIMVEQTLSIWAKKLGHNGFIQNIIIYQNRLNELLSVPDYSKKSHSQWFYLTKDSEESVPGAKSVSREKQRANMILSRQELAERKKKIAFHNYAKNYDK